MSRLLAATLSVVNGFAAIIIIFVCTFVGYGFFDGERFGLVFGFIGGLILAGLVCGTIALLVLIERHLRALSAAKNP